MITLHAEQVVKLIHEGAVDMQKQRAHDCLSNRTDSRKVMKRVFPFLCLVFSAMVMDAYATSMTVGDQVPDLTFTDVYGQKAGSGDYQDWAVVYTVANRESNKKLTAWLLDAGEEVVRAHPEIRLAFINFADVKNVPRLFRGLVKPYL